MTDPNARETVRAEPWARSTGVGSGSGRAFVALDTVNDPRATVRVAGTRYAALRTGARDEEGLEIWELPVAWTASATATHPQVELEIRGARAPRRLVRPVPRPARRTEESEPNADEPDPEDPHGLPPLESVLSQHVEATRQWLDGEEERLTLLTRRAAGLTSVPLDDYCAEYWRYENREQAPLSPIVRIAHECTDLIEQLCRHPRRVLSRARELVPLAKAQQVDDACLRWLVRQPGHTVPEKAGPRQRVRAVVREEHIDTHENRVLRDFLRLSARAARSYIARHARHRESPRYRDVTRFLHTVRRLSRTTEIAKVPPLTGHAEPNYVLQFDPRYSIVWHWYDQLRRQAQLLDDLHAWHHRIWAERSLTALLLLLEHGRAKHASCRGRLMLSGEATAGRFFDRHSRLGPWAFARTRRGSVVRCLHQDELAKAGAVAPLQRLVPDAVLVRGDPFDGDAVDAALAVFAMFVPDDDDADLRARLERLDAALMRLRMEVTLGAVLFVPERGDCAALVQSASRRVCACRLPLPRSQDRSRGWQAIHKAVRAFMESTA